MIKSRFIAGAILLLAAAPSTAAEPEEDVVVQVFEDEVIQWRDETPEHEDADGFVTRFPGHTVTRTIVLPTMPANQRDARRIIATVSVEAIESEVDGMLRPNDPWTRLGSITVEAAPGADTGRDGVENGDTPREIEIMRFITGYGAPGEYEQDVTALAPLLGGQRTIRGFISTYSERPGWRVSLALRYSSRGLGQRRPTFAAGLINDMHVHAEAPTVQGSAEIPEGLARPRLRVLSTGHATDGIGGNEFVTCTNVLRVDGVEVARWRPWSERGGQVRDLNPWAGRLRIGGREVRSSDFDRSGWHPGLVVEPVTIPLPELTPGTHLIEIEILGIREKDPPNEAGTQHHGYWVVSGVIVADEPWPGPEGDGL